MMDKPVPYVVLMLALNLLEGLKKLGKDEILKVLLGTSQTRYLLLFVKFANKLFSNT